MNELTTYRLKLLSAYEFQIDIFGQCDVDGLWGFVPYILDHAFAPGWTLGADPPPTDVAFVTPKHM